MPNRHIALIGPMAAGKTTLARYIEQNFGYKRYSLASAVKQDLSNLLGITLDEIEARKGEYRTALQQIGTEKRTLDPEYWVKKLWEQYLADKTAEPMVIDDVRYLNEMTALRHLVIHRNKQQMIPVGVMTADSERVNRYFAAYGRYPSQEQLDHESETSFLRIAPAYVITGYGDLREKHAYIERIIKDDAYGYRYDWHHTSWYITGDDAAESYYNTQSLNIVDETLARMRKYGY